MDRLHQHDEALLLCWLDPHRHPGGERHRYYRPLLAIRRSFRKHQPGGGHERDPDGGAPVQAIWREPLHLPVAADHIRFYRSEDRDEFGIAFLPGEVVRQPIGQVHFGRQHHPVNRRCISLGSLSGRPWKSP